MRLGLSQFLEHLKSGSRLFFARDYSIKLNSTCKGLRGLLQLKIGSKLISNLKIFVDLPSEAGNSGKPYCSKLSYVTSTLCDRLR